jgi:hypothetical protein
MSLFDLREQVDGVGEALLQQCDALLANVGGQIVTVLYISSSPVCSKRSGAQMVAVIGAIVTDSNAPFPCTTPPITPMMTKVVRRE